MLMDNDDASCSSKSTNNDTTNFTTDADSTLCTLEKDFLENDGRFVEFTDENWWSKVATAKHFESVEMLSSIIPKNVIYSRITKKHYVVTDAIGISDLADKFEYTGHTLGIDYQKSYVRYLAFDIDCMCRKIENCENHNTIDDAKHIAIDLMRLLINSKLVRVDEAANVADTQLINDRQLLEVLDNNCCIWKNDCGYHIYTNIPVSITLHELLLLSLNANQYPRCKIEIPKIMPLPYSAKYINTPYTPLRANQYMPNVIITTNVSGVVPFNDNVIILPSNGTLEGSNKALTICMKESDPNGSQILHYNTVLLQSRCIPIYPNVNIITRANSGFATKLLYDYVNSMSRKLKNWLSTMDFDATENNQQSPELCEDLNYKTHATTDFNNYHSNKYEYLTKSFMLTFNKNFIGGTNVDADESFFIGYSLDSGCLYLQHYVVMYHLWLLEHASPDLVVTCSSVINCLAGIYTQDIIDESMCLREFLKYYSDTTLGAYKNTSYEIMEHFAYLKTFDIKPHMNTIEILMKIMSQKFKSPTNYHEEIFGLKKSEREMHHMEAFECYCRILHELGIVMVDSQTNKCYVLNHHVYTSDDVCPNILSHWIRDSNSSKYNSTAITTYLRMQEYSKTIDPKLMFTTTEFQFQTNVGTFNSITGLYSSHCKFLRFTRKRDYAIWYDPFQSEINQTENQNLRCLQLQQWTSEFSSKIPEFVNSLFLDFTFLPAILQIGMLPSISEKNLMVISQLLTDSDIPSSVDFLVEYYQMHPIYIYLISMIYRRYDGFITLYDYTTLRTHLFQHRRSNDDDWYEFLLAMARECDYDRNANTHMERLQSIHDVRNLDNLDPSFALRISIFALLVSRCVSFKTFNVACAAVCNTIEHQSRDENLDILMTMDRTKILPHYVNLMDKMSNIKTKDELIDIYRENLKITRNRVFTNISNKPLPFDKNGNIRQCIINTFIIVCMSSFFNCETVKNVIDAFSLLFVTKNLKKKLILFYGKSGVGKSELCNMIRYMMAPFVGVYNNNRYDAANQRANVSTTTNCIILTEVEAIDGNSMKSQTGNDAVSAIRFFTTTYDLRDSQALLYGNTNGHINFKTAVTKNVDQVTIDRLHVIELTGQQIDAEESNVTDFLSMLVNNTIFKNTVPLNVDNIQHYAICMAMLSFVNYKETRSKQDYMPALNINTPSSVIYRNETFKLNNKLYRFLLNLGFQREQKFFIGKQELLHVVNKAIERTKRQKKKSSIMYNCEDDFFIAFKHEFHVDLNGSDNCIIEGIQEYGLIAHIKDNMRVEPALGKCITNDDVEACISAMFGSSETDYFTTNKENARAYMQRINIDKYDSVNKFYRDIIFVQDTTEYNANYVNVVSGGVANEMSNKNSYEISNGNNIVSSASVTNLRVSDIV
uniref:RsgA_1 protein n=1 Tax=Fopius arisanus TaxID=64838 RepID=A0A0C9RAY0_9HYME